MNTPTLFRQRALSRAVALAVLSLGASATLHAADPVDLGSVSASGGTATTPVKSVAAQVAPTQSDLQATQPKSIINRSFFEDAKSPASDYATLAAIAPSVSGGISANGPGLSETKNNLRGFPDGNYNITFDGIPFGDTNGPTHHSTAYFPSDIIGQVVVERGPGGASNIGQATFGGSVNLISRNLEQERTVGAYVAVGSWNTRQYGIRYDTGPVSSWGDARLAMNYTKLTSDGYRTFSAVQSTNYMLEFQKALGDHTVLTLFMNHNDNWYQDSDVSKGLTIAQAGALGKNYWLGNDPTKADYWAYSKTSKNTNMNYARLQSDLGSGWAVDNTLYYDSYTNHTLSSTLSNTSVSATNMAPNGYTAVYTTANASGSKGGPTVLGIPGYVKTNSYWVMGNIFKATKQLDSGLLRAGLWIERQDSHRATEDYNMLTMSPNYDQSRPADQATAPSTNVKYAQDSASHQYQPFVEFEWAATKNLTITPGVKQMNTHLIIDATMNQTDRIGQNVSKDFSAVLPFLTANYKLNDASSVYAQFAKGMLVPDISSFYSKEANRTEIEPQKSTNYQIGFVHQSGKLAFDADVYYIDFSNKLGTYATGSVVNGVTLTDTMQYNQGGVVYKGFEGQATYALDNGISLYGNGSRNSAASKTTFLQIKEVPRMTAALGLLYKAGGWNASLMHKYVGPSWVNDDQVYQLGSYTTTDLSVGYTFANPGAGMKELKVNAGIYNLLDHQDMISAKTSGNTTAASDTFVWQPPRSYMLTLRGKF